MSGFEVRRVEVGLRWENAPVTLGYVAGGGDKRERVGPEAQMIGEMVLNTRLHRFRSKRWKIRDVVQYLAKKRLFTGHVDVTVSARL
ncbi:hypothetical protein EYF80_039770 [Liparis tanakae]|uniref:Uncharacterized protein n=1 Tax=Liparis tanakae TaxID=230148 RepID=A0A4Z2G921_9TELE|nr:hypothetical protein EYF80_039770 [Liparis tanakae]